MVKDILNKENTIKTGKTAGLAGLGAIIVYLLSILGNISGLAPSKAEIPAEQVQKITDIAKTVDKLNTIMSDLTEVKSEIKILNNSVNNISKDLEREKVKVEILKEQVNDIYYKKNKRGKNE